MVASPRYETGSLSETLLKSGTIQGRFRAGGKTTDRRTCSGRGPRSFSVSGLRRPMIGAEGSRGYDYSGTPAPQEEFRHQLSELITPGGFSTPSV